jgi:hypothetical protein
MSRLLHCARCGALFVVDRYVSLLPRRWRLCPRCRGPLPSSGAVRDCGRLGPVLAEVRS